MTDTILSPIPLTPQDFAPYGDVLAAEGDHVMINEGWCKRFHDRARLETDDAGRAGISIFHAQPRHFPYRFDLIERHPLGSQAFLPMTQHPFLVIVAAEAGARPVAFLTNGRQGINLHRGTWHGVLTPLAEPGLFAVVDRIGTGVNLEEYRYAQPWTVVDQGARS